LVWGQPWPLIKFGSSWQSSTERPLFPQDCYFEVFQWLAISLCSPLTITASKLGKIQIATDFCVIVADSSGMKYMSVDRVSVSVGMNLLALLIHYNRTTFHLGSVAKDSKETYIGCIIIISLYDRVLCVLAPPIMTVEGLPGDFLLHPPPCILDALKCSR
jgi:hypothetical protein